MPATTPILYSFRRCPYAMRARLALDMSGQVCELREVVLRDKPQEMLLSSAKGTVPVLIDAQGVVTDESLDIMIWALRRNDPEGWLTPERDDLESMLSLVGHFDAHFKWHLDRYKYPSRFVDTNAEDSRREAGRSLMVLEDRLGATDCLFGNRPALADMAIAPFVRQFSAVDPVWFAGQAWPQLRKWLATIIESKRFTRIMRPTVAWVPGTVGVQFPFVD